MVWRISDPQGNEAGKVKHLIVPYTRGKVLDLGCGPSKAFPHFVGVDNLADTALFGIQMRPDLVVPDCADLQEHIQDESCDSVFSSHLLEHIADYHAALRSWWKCIKPGGHLVLYLPHRDLYPNIGQYGANPDHKHDFVPQDIIAALDDVTAEAGGFDVMVNETRGEGFEYSFLLVLKKLTQQHTGFYSYTLPRPEKTACVCRYGGVGDMIQASATFPALKREGYHVTVMTTPAGKEIVENDPYVDAFLVQDTDQVPNDQLTEYWEAQAKRFDRFINFSESVEGTLLAYPGRTSHAWPDAVRRKYLGRNYLEWMAELAELPYLPEARFYPTEAERAAAGRFLTTARLRNAGLEGRAGPVAAPATFNVLWTLAGSSIHKMYPHQDIVIGNLLRAIPECTVTLVGDPLCELLEAGWENNPRVHCLSGKIGIRETLALAQQVDVVVGPETGVLNAVAFEPNGKVVILSHSSHENLSRDWVNAESIDPPTACHPCHRLHYDRTYCPEHEASGASMCAWEVDPYRVFAAITRLHADWKRLRELRAAA